MPQTSGPSQFLLIFRGGHDAILGLPQDEMQRYCDRAQAWFERLSKTGKVLGGNALEAGGVVISGRRGEHVTDGPFAETSEAIGGYVLVQAESLAEATALVRDLPGLAYGGSVEVRAVGECPVAKKLAELRAEAGAPA